MLDLNRLEKYRDEILKAEIGALLFNLGKTHIGFWKKKQDNNQRIYKYFNVDDESVKNIFGFKPFTEYRKYYKQDGELGKSPFEYELEKYNLKNFIFDKKVRFPFKTDGKSEIIKWISFFKGDALENNEDDKEFIQKIFFRGCENVNSGIDKGSPNKQLEPPLWLSNAFGSFKEKIKEENFDPGRRCFFSNLERFLKEKNYLQNQNWEEIRKFVLKEIKNWYSHLLSDSRFPVNDVTLFDQAYMTASMFKAILAQLVMYDSKLNNYQNNPSSIKWRILGIQYDKMGLAEKGLKLASIKWYRDITKKIDEGIKRLLEIEYPIGNEIYRDETGIYFIVGEDLGKDTSSEETKLNQGLEKLEEKIFNIFDTHLKGEAYPYISLTKASRGLMNLSRLLENAKENFLKIKYKKSGYNLDLEKKAIGICPICKVRLIYEEDKEKNNKPPICEVCDSRIHHSQVSDWLKDMNGETIWIDEIKDKNNRVAYISLKFELEDWLSGDLLNSLLVRKKENKYIDLVNNTKQLIQNDKKIEEGKIEGYIWGIPKTIKVRQFIKSWLLERSIGQKWEQFIKSKLSNPNAIDFENRNINWNLLNEQDIEFLAELTLQFLLRKNPSPARLRRIWESTQEFFENIHKNLDEDLKIPEWRKKRLVWEVDYTDKIKESGEELEGNGLKFWAQPNKDKIKVYLISSIEDFIEKFGNKDLIEELNKKDDKEIDKEKIRTLFKEHFEINLKKYFEDKGEEETLIILTKDNPLEIHSYKPYSLITDISPINYQIIVPSEYLPKFVDNVLEKYNKEFKYVYGKLPIHIGIVVSNYKKPLYVSLKALRKIRRDVKNTKKLWINENTAKFCQLQKEKLSYATTEEKINDTEDYYALYFDNKNEKDYNFYIKPSNDWKYWISTLDKFPLNSKIKIIPNTFDFEFMDTNTRRNDIYYDENYKRALGLKSNRPYELEVYWNKFKVFRELFKDKTNTAKMHKLVSLFYEKLQNYDERYNPLLASAIVNILELKKNKDTKKFISQIFDLDENALNFQKELIEKLNEEKLKLFIDMFEFWHTALKEV